MSISAIASQALPMLLGGGGGSTEVSTSNTQSFNGSLDPVFNISLGGSIESDPSRFSTSSPTASAQAIGDPESNPLGGFSALFPQQSIAPAYAASAAPSLGGGMDFLPIILLAGGAFLLLGKKGK